MRDPSKYTLSMNTYGSVRLCPRLHDTQTDILLGLLKGLQAKRRGTKKPLSIVVMSATLDAGLFEVRFPMVNVAALFAKKGVSDR